MCTDKVHSYTTRTGLFVQCRMRLNIMRNVANVYTHFIGIITHLANRKAIVQHYKGDVEYSYECSIDNINLYYLRSLQDQW